ncbi:MAG: LPXTG cell wall anchor domain-containing protein [Clostridia bacterium]|nr:LPXTG cell wall anchor domain-containing protein [Clostridia bacterium]
MKTIKKIIISIIVGIIALIGFHTTATAYSVGETVSIDYSTYEQDPNMFCVQHNQHLHKGDYQDYQIISQVNIKGNDSVDHLGGKQTSWYNAKLAYILSKDNGSGLKALGPVANSIWNNMHTWMSNVGQYHAGLSLNFTSDKRGGYSPLDAESDAYANSIINLQETAQAMEDHTDKNKIKVVSANKDNKDYIKIGPFNWTFGTPLTKVTAQGTGDMTIHFFSSYNGREEYFYNEASEIQSGKDFYIYLKMDLETEKLSSLTGYSTTMIKTAKIWFLKSPNGYYQNLIIRESGEEPMDISTTIDYGIKTKGKLKILKVNKKDQTILLPGVSFYIQHKETGKYLAKDSNGKIIYVNEAHKSAFKTGARGANKGRINLKDLAVGTYIAYEKDNPNYGYVVDTETTQKELIIDKSRTPMELEEWKIANPQVYIRLSGYVWIDKRYGKDAKANNIFKDQEEKGLDGSVLDQNDILFNGITVRLIDKTTGKIVKNEKEDSSNYGKEMETVTSQLNRYKGNGNDGNGEYLIEDVLIEKLGDYYMEFEYDGLIYTNVPRNVTKDNGSKAAEGQDARQEFNDKFASIEGAGKLTAVAKDKDGNEQQKFDYEEIDEGRAIQYKNNQQFMITANTDAKDTDTSKNYVIKEHFVNDLREIQYINLGLTEREQPDIGIEKDLHNVRLEVNGCGHTYLYSQRLSHPTEYDSEGGLFNVAVRWSNKYKALAYKRPIYEADYNYINEKDKSKELKVYLTYQIVMLNKTPQNLTTRVNSLVDYYDSNYELLHVGTKLNENGSVVNDIRYEQDEEFTSQDYKKAIIYNETSIVPESKDNRESVYVEFALNREAVIKILNDQTNLDNIVEVNSYSVLKDGKSYAGIDMNSIPGNYEIGENVREDDTSIAPALKLEPTDAREMAGKVFLDNQGISPEIQTGKIRQGTGKYEEGEEGIGDVAVTLTDISDNGIVVYRTKTVNAPGKYGYIETVEEDDKEVHILEPELYNDANKNQYKFVTEDGQDLNKGDFFIVGYIPSEKYVLTYTWGDQTYTVQNYKGTIYPNKERQNNQEWYKENADIRYNDAMDNYETRKEIDSEMTEIKYNTQTTKQKMNSSTPNMHIGVEYDTTTTASVGDRYSYRIKNVDFGIIERAKQRLDIVKRIKTLKATLTNGQVIANLEIDENGNVTGDQKNVTYMKPDPLIQPNNGFIRLELDNELIQGTTLEVGYEIKAINQSELDYLSEEYYHYGEIVGPVITITPTTIIDYLDKDWSFDSEKNPDWKVIQKEELSTYEQGGLVIKEVYEDSEESESTINEKIILLTNTLANKKIEPGKSEPVMLHVSRILTSTDEISLDNETENIKINRPGGSKPQAIPGNYVPGTGSTEVDDSMAETTIVTPATGENQNYVMPIIIGATALITLGVGVIIIKKRIL